MAKLESGIMRDYNNCASKDYRFMMIYFLNHKISKILEHYGFVSIVHIIEHVFVQIFTKTCFCANICVNMCEHVLTYTLTRA